MMIMVIKPIVKKQICKLHSDDENDDRLLSNDDHHGDNANDLDMMSWCLNEGGDYKNEKRLVAGYGKLPWHGWGLERHQI